MQLFLQNVWRFRFYVVNLQPETRTRQASRWSLNRRVVFVIVIVPSLLFGGFGRMNSFDKITGKTHYLSLYKFFSIKYCWFSNNICIFALGFGFGHFQDILVKTKHWLLFRGSLLAHSCVLLMFIPILCGHPFLHEWRVFILRLPVNAKGKGSAPFSFLHPWCSLLAASRLDSWMRLKTTIRWQRLMI